MNMKECSCFRHEGGRSYCVGTKECNDCSCGGELAKCDFYPENRRKADEELKCCSGELISAGILNVDAIRAIAKNFKKPFISITINISEDGMEDNRA